MHQQNKQSSTTNTKAFSFNFIAPYSTFTDDKPLPIPYVIDGLLTQGGFSVLAGKPKSGKSSFSRHMAVQVAKGLPVIGRDTTRGEVILISLEDPANHTDNCLKALGYDSINDSQMHIVTQIAPRLEETIQALDDALASLPNVGLVVIDTLAKFLRVKDLNEYMPVMTAVEPIHHLARKYPHIHIIGLAHCKKAKTDETFDSLLGSTALRGETDTNIALYLENGKRVIETETRVGRNIEPTIIEAQLVEVGGANVVENFHLAGSFAEWKSDVGSKAEHKRVATLEDGIIEHLKETGSGCAKQSDTLQAVVGNNASKIAAIERLCVSGVITKTGDKQSPVNPTVLHLNESALPLHNFNTKFGDTVN